MTEIRGPLGFWPFPLFNLLMNMVQSKGQMRQRPMLPAPGRSMFTNKEEITFDDWKGRTRRITIHRTVE